MAADDGLESMVAVRRKKVENSGVTESKIAWED